MAASAGKERSPPAEDGIDPREALRRLDGTKEAWVITSDLDGVPRPVRQACSDSFSANPLKHFAVVVFDRTYHIWFILERNTTGVVATIVKLGDITALSKTAGYKFEASGRSVVQFLESEDKRGYDLRLNNCQVFAHHFWEELGAKVDFETFFN